MDNYCSHCGQRMPLSQFEQQALRSTPGGGVLGFQGLPDSAGCPPAGSIVSVPAGSIVSVPNGSAERLVMALRAHRPRFTKDWHSIKVHLTAEEMEEERQYKRETIMKNRLYDNMSLANP